MFLLQDFVDKCIWDSAQSKTTAKKGGVGFHVSDSFGCGGEDFIDFMTGGCGCKCASYDKGLLEAAN